MATVFFGVAMLALIVLNGVLAYLLMRSRKKPDDDTQGLLLLQNQIQELTKSLDHKVGESTKAMQDSTKVMHESLRSQLAESHKIVREVTEGLTKLDETNRQVVSFADQLQGLQDILKNPKQRGILGEYYLETVLKNVLPPSSYQMQYGFSDGTVVDAVVFVDKRIIPIDSKFSLENYNRMVQSRDPVEKKKFETAFVNDLKLRIDETAKYVKPEEKTMDFSSGFTYLA